MKYAGYALPELIPGTLVKRYKRFLADVELDNGKIVTAHCPNSGSMKGCSEPGKRVYLSENNNPKRKLKYTWELLEMPSTLVGINTQIPNKLVKKSIENGLIEELCGYSKVKSEIKITEHTRLDLLLEKSTGEECYVEVKNCTLVEDHVAKFPDAVTKRGRKHLVELERLVSLGKRGIIFFLIQRMDARSFMPAADIDPGYAGELKKVSKSGVEVIARDTIIDISMIRMGKKLPVILP